MGLVVTLSEDEFFKAVAYRGELHGLSMRESKNMYNDLLAKGVDEKTASKQAKDYFAELIDNPTDEIHQAATQHARVMTFTNELGGAMQAVNKTINKEIMGFPIGKLFFPFVYQMILIILAIAIARLLLILCMLLCLTN